MDAEKWADIQDIASRLEEMLQTAPENYYYVKGYIHCLSAKKRGLWETAGVSVMQQASASGFRNF